MDKILATSIPLCLGITQEVVTVMSGPPAVVRMAVQALRETESNLQDNRFQVHYPGKV